MICKNLGLENIRFILNLLFDVVWEIVCNMLGVIRLLMEEQSVLKENMNYLL
jgi:hypothetical protein